MKFNSEVCWKYEGNPNKEGVYDVKLREGEIDVHTRLKFKNGNWIMDNQIVTNVVAWKFMNECRGVIKYIKEK